MVFFKSMANVVNINHRYGPDLGMFIIVNKFRIKRPVGQADMTLALLGQNLYKYLGIL